MQNRSHNDHAWLPKRLHHWLGSRQARVVLLGAALCWSWPAGFAVLPDIGLDSSWQLSLQLAAIQGKVFGRDFVFTYGPLGYLLIHAAVNKAVLLLYDLFVLGSLLSIYRALLPPRPALRDAFLIMALAVVTKTGWETAPAATLFTILCHWLWRVYDRADVLAVVCSLVAALVIFFGKVNYGLIMIFLIPAYGLGVLILQRKRPAPGIPLVLGFPALVFLGATTWHVDLPNYLRSSVELIAGYNEAMFAYSNSRFVFALSGLFLLGMGITAFLGRHRLSWREQAMFLPLIGFAALLLFKNAFVRSDEIHQQSFFAALPLLLAVWCVGWRGAAVVRVLLLASLFYPLAQLTAQTKVFKSDELVTVLPLSYARELITAPWRENAAFLQDRLRAQYPEATLPAGIRSIIGDSSVDVMPWESSIAILNGLNYQPRPVPQSYTAYTAWLDRLNSRFLGSTNASDYLFYACAQNGAIDGRPAAWDESLAKIALLENYSLETEFNLPMRVWPYQRIEPARVFLLKHAPHLRRLIPVATNEVSVALGQPLSLPTTTNLVFLTLEANRTIFGKWTAAAVSPGMLMACFEYQDGSSAYYRAILPILKTGVLVNRRVVSLEETRNWLEMAATRNAAVSSICFKTHSSWAFRTPFKGFLVEYRLVETESDPSLR